MGKKYNNLISTTAGFNYAAEQPLDDREVVQSYEDLATLVSSHVSYDGMEVYVVDDKKSYKLIESEWVAMATETWVESQIENIGGVGETTDGGGEIFNDYTSNVASGKFSHAEGSLTTAKGGKSHAGGQESAANGDRSFVHGLGLIADATEQAVFGRYNAIDKNQLFIIGNGSSVTEGEETKVTPRNVFTIDGEGRTVVGYPEESNHAATKSYVDDAIRSNSNTAFETITIGNTTLTEEQLIKILNFIDTIEMTGGNE